MTELGAALEMMHTAARRFRTVTATIREWRDQELELEAGQRRYAGQQVPPHFGPSRPKLAPIESLLRLWYRPPDRWRMVSEMPDCLGGSTTTAVNGRGFWTSSADGSMFSNLGRASARTGPGPQAYLDPAEAIGGMPLELVGRGVQGGRPAIHLQGHYSPHGVHRYACMIPVGANTCDLWIDVERGTLLRMEVGLDDRPFRTWEVTEIAYDADFTDALFTLEPPPGVPVRTPDDPPGANSPPRSLEDAVQLVPFRVLTPTRVPEGARMRIHLAPGHEQLAIPATVNIQYLMPAARHRLSLSESAAAQDPTASRDQAGERIVRIEQEMFYREIPGGRQVYLHTQGTSVLVDSDLDRETLFQIVDSLAVASPEPRG